MAGYAADVFQHIICPLLAAYGVPLVALAGISNLFRDMTRSIAFRHNLQQMIISEKAWMLTNQKTKIDSWCYFTLSGEQLYGNIRKVFPGMPLRFEDIGMLPFEDYIFKNLRQFVSFHRDGLINNILCPPGEEFVRISILEDVVVPYFPFEDSCSGVT
eukprot:TRINITY_DN781_c0_g1_i1.p1 TRINITY_DN781_c0_g1~~TRINITY_DN781_c0_g1_i1.p1  ORF type:complete len:158 (+),score=13.18 TRINITY_DN781_c0_g1_i1:227-700(+)